MRKIAVWNRKGGVAKSTVAVNLSIALTHHNKRVLLIDLDGQANSTYWLSCEEQKLKAMDILVGQKSISSAMVEIRPNLFIVGSSKNIIIAEKKLQDFEVLNKQLNNIKPPLTFDFVIFDCAPSYNKLHDCVLNTIEEVFIPVSMDPLALVGTLQVYDILRERDDFKKKEVMVIPTFIDRRNKRTDIILDELKKTFNYRLSCPIRICSKLAEAPSHHMSIFEYAPKCQGSEDFKDLAEWVIEYGPKRQSA